jgi:hypothetical protein
MRPYEPPKQGVRGQIVDSVIILALLFAVLFGVTYYVQSSEETATPERPKPIAELPISATEKQQFQKAVDEGIVDLEAVNQQVADNRPRDDKYPIGIGAALATFGVIGVYLIFVYVVSFREYREVVRERFDSPGEAAAGTGSEVGT